MTDPMKIILWDSGHWGGTFSESRIFSALRMLELTSGGKLCIEEMRYVQTTDTDLSTRLPSETHRAYNLREEKRNAIHSARVEKTARFFNYKFQEENIASPSLHPITQEGSKLFVVVMPPGKERTRLITSLLRLKIEAPLVIAPAVFEDNAELDRFIDEESISKEMSVIPFVPFRYSHSMLTLAALKKSKPIELIEASVLAGKYPPMFRVGAKALVREFSAPVLDCVVHAAGCAVEGSIIYKAQLSPCILINAVHENQVVSSIHISAISKFQQININLTAFFDKSRLCFQDAFRDTIHYDGDDDVIRVTESSRGHDVKIEEKNGYSELLSNIINHQKDLPTLKSFSNTQKLIDQIFDSISSSISQMQKQKTSQAHTTF